MYPAHGAGSLCGKAISKETVSTIGEQRRSNYALQPMTKAAFVDLVTADQPDAPRLLHLRRGAEQQGAADARRGARARAAADDARSGAGAAATSADRFSTRATRTSSPPRTSPAASTSASAASTRRGPGTMLSREHPIVDHRGPRTRARIGGPSRPHRLRSRRRLPEGRTAQPGIASGSHGVHRARQRAARGGAAGRGRQPLAVDVRTPRERDAKRVAGSVSIPLNHLARARAGSAEGSAAARVLRRRLPVVDRREPAAAARLQRR